MVLPSNLPKLLMLTAAGLQGLGIYLLYRSFDEGLWPSQSPMWFYPMISLVLLLPAGFLLTVERSRERARDAGSGWRLRDGDWVAGRLCRLSGDALWRGPDRRIVGHLCD